MKRLYKEFSSCIVSVGNDQVTLSREGWLKLAKVLEEQDEKIKQLQEENDNYSHNVKSLHRDITAYQMALAQQRFTIKNLEKKLEERR